MGNGQKPYHDSRPAKPLADDTPETPEALEQHFFCRRIMKSGEDRSSAGARHGLGLVLVLLVGCASGRPQFDRAQLADRARGNGPQEVTAGYRLGCPDALEVAVAGREDVGGRTIVGPDGCIDLGTLGRLRVEGLTAVEAGDHLAGLAAVSRDGVTVRVAAFNSKRIYLAGEVAGPQRAVAYRGPETVPDLLQRVGGVTPGAAPEKVLVIRSRVAEGKPPEVFHIQLRDIALNHDDSTNVRLQPFDEVYVGETRQASMACCIPSCIRPLYEALCGLRRRPGSQAAASAIPAGEELVARNALSQP
jgi:protein involved in polysaccharide export with SLBB domain